MRTAADQPAAQGPDRYQRPEQAAQGLLPGSLLLAASERGGAGRAAVLYWLPSQAPAADWKCQDGQLLLLNDFVNLCHAPPDSKPLLPCIRPRWILQPSRNMTPGRTEVCPHHLHEQLAIKQQDQVGVRSSSSPEKDGTGRCRFSTALNSSCTICWSSSRDSLPSTTSLQRLAE